MNLADTDNTRSLNQFGFCFGEGGTHLARTMMLEDVTRVFEHCGDALTRDDVLEAVAEENCLGKPSKKSRALAARHLLRLYGFDQKEAVFRAMTFLWDRDPESRPQLAFLNAYSRDPMVRLGTPFLFDLEDGEKYDRLLLEKFIESVSSERFSAATKTALAQRLAGTWTQSGHLEGKSKKLRRHVGAHPGSVVMALLLSYLSGHRGMLTFESEYVKLLDCSPTSAIEIAKIAAQRGWMDIKHIGSVVEVAFPQILTDEEVEKIREQG